MVAVGAASKAAAMEIKICKTKAMLVGAQDTGVAREEDCVAVQQDSSVCTHRCADCGDAFPSASSLSAHKQHCRSPATQQSWGVSAVTDDARTSMGLQYRVAWAGKNAETGRTWLDSWEPAARLGEDAACALAIEQFQRRKAAPGWLPPPKGWSVNPGPHEEWREAAGCEWQCDHCCSWWGSDRGRKIHQARCQSKPTTKGTGGKLAKSVHRIRRKNLVREYGTVKVGNDPIEWVESFCYLGDTVRGDCDNMAPVEARTAQAAARFRELAAIWCDKKLNVKVKIRLYKSAVGSIVRYGSDGYSLDATARRRLKDFNAKRLAVITGRSIEAENRNPSYDLVKDVRLARLKWLGHILRLDENITLHKTIKDLYTNGIHHDGMLMDEAPNSKDFEELVEIARERSGWREFAKEKCSEQFNPARTRAPIGEPNLTEERGGNRVGTRDRTLFKAHTHNVPKVMNKN